MNFFTQIDIKEGLNKARIEDGVFSHISDFSIINLKKESELHFSTEGSEVCLVILEGSCDIKIDGKTFSNLGSRANVFSGKPTAVYIPRNKRYSLIAKNVQLAMCSSVSDKDSNFKIIYPQDINEKQVGRDNWSREVRLIIDRDAGSTNLIVGETLNPAGNWSGTPAHKHEVDNPPSESHHEELYYFKCDKKNGFGIERFYSPNRGINELIYLKENTVTLMPWGYHQIVAAPGYTLYYLFFLSGPSNKLIGNPDPEHKWINEQTHK